MEKKEKRNKLLFPIICLLLSICTIVRYAPLWKGETFDLAVGGVSVACMSILLLVRELEECGVKLPKLLSKKSLFLPIGTIIIILTSCIIIYNMAPERYLEKIEEKWGVSLTGNCNIIERVKITTANCEIQMKKLSYVNPPQIFDKHGYEDDEKISSALDFLEEIGMSFPEIDMDNILFAEFMRDADRLLFIYDKNSNEMYSIEVNDIT